MTWSYNLRATLRIRVSSPRLSFRLRDIRTQIAHDYFAPLSVYHISDVLPRTCNVYEIYRPITFMMYRPISNINGFPDNMAIWKGLPLCIYLFIYSFFLAQTLVCFSIPPTALGLMEGRVCTMWKFVGNEYVTLGYRSGRVECIILKCRLIDLNVCISQRTSLRWRNEAPLYLQLRSLTFLYWTIHSVHAYFLLLRGGGTILRQFFIKKTCYYDRKLLSLTVFSCGI